MTEIKITRDDVVVINTVSNNSYGDLLFTDKGGGEYKISDKRVKHFEGIILPDTAVKLSFALSSRGTEYIHKAVAVAGELPPQAPKLKPEQPKEKPSEVAPQERGMWWKEVGEMIRAGKISSDKPEGALMIRAYYAQMFTSLGIELKDKK